MNADNTYRLDASRYHVRLALVLALTALVYYSGLTGDFEFDDTLNIVRNGPVALTQLDFSHIQRAMFSGFSGPLGRPIAMLSFAINHYFTGFDPYFFKLTNLIIHLLNGIGIFALTRWLLRAHQKLRQPALSGTHIQWLSLAVAAAWLLHPLNLSGVLYIVQRMASLASLFTLGGLIFYVRGRMRMCDGKSGVAEIMACLLVFLPLALFSKENGALLPLFLLAIEWALFGFKTADRGSRRFLYGLFGLIVALPILMFLLRVIAQPEGLTGGYAIREFTLPERLMTEARILWFYLRMIVLPDNAELGIYHDDIPVSQGLLQPESTLLAIAGIAVLSIIAMAARKRAPIVSLGLLLFLVGHSLESTIFPLELAHEHRNYLPIYGILLILFYYLLYPFRYPESFRLRHYLAGLFIALLGLTTAVRASYWGDLTEHGLIEVGHHPDSCRANYEAGRTSWLLLNNYPDSKEKYYEQARHYFERATMLQSNDVNGLIALVRLNYALEKPIDPGSLALLRQRLAEKPFAPSSASALIGLSECQIDELCHLPPPELDSIFRSALRNPTLSGQTKAMVSAAAAMSALTVRNTPLALEYSNQAIEANPADLQLRLNLANLLIALGQPEPAREQLGIVTRLDKSHAYTREIEQAKEAASKAQNDKPT